MRLIPTWAWMTLAITLLVTIGVALIGIQFVLDDKETIDRTTDDLSDRPVRVEVAKLPTLTPTATDTPLPSATPSPTDTALPTATNTPLATSAPTQATLETASLAPTSTIDECAPPAGWQPHTVTEGDTLFAFQLGAGRAGTPTTVDEILDANCLGTTFLQIGQVVWLPTGAVENAPSSEPAAPSNPPGVPRSANCPCTITINAGWRVEQIADEINRQSVAFSGADFLAVAGKGAALPARDFLASVPGGVGLEGFMLPGSYTLQNETTAEQFRDILLDAFAANAAGIINNAASQGITPYQAVILASIVQRESGATGEQALVASVFHNRLRSGRGIGATVTIQYALGGPGNWWPRLQPGQTDFDSPYNTLLYAGFPPTAISNPGLGALQSAVSPAQTNYLYFTGNCHGTGNLYAETYEQHLANVQSCS